MTSRLAKTTEFRESIDFPGAIILARNALLGIIYTFIYRNINMCEYFITVLYNFRSIIQTFG
jgi:hypothetical protein